MKEQAGKPSVLGKGFSILNAFGAGGQELTLGQLVERTQLPRSTVHRLAGQLTEQGALEATRRGWRLGLRLFELGQLVPSQQRLREIALPYMNGLYESTHATIQLGMLDETDVVYVEVISGHRRVKTPSRRGGRMPAHCTALGKVLLAFTDGAIDGIGQGPLEKRTTRTIDDPAELRAVTRGVRRSGIAFDDEESRLGLCCVAAPIIGGDGKTIAALSVSLSTADQLTPRQVEPALRLAALAVRRAISQRGVTAV